MKRSLTALKVAGYGTKSAPLPPLSLTPRIASSLPRAKKAPSSSGGSTTSSGSSSTSTVTPSYQPSGSGSSGTRSTPPKKSGGDTIPGTNGHYSG
jgi:hypothetical protein